MSKVRGILRTDRYMPRPVQLFGPTVEHVAAMADKYLDDPACRAGDRFEIYEEQLVLVQPWKGHEERIPL